MAIIKVIEIQTDTQKAQKALDDINLTLQQQEDLLKDTQRQIEKLEDLRDKTSKKDANRLREINQEIKNQNKNLKRTKTRIQENKQARSKSNKVLKESVKDQKDYSGVLGLIDRQTGGAISGFQGMTQGIAGATKGFKLMKVAIIATGIGALVIGITAVATAFTNSESGQNKFSKMMTQIGVVVGNVTDILGSLGKTIMSVLVGDFDAAAESMNKMTDGIKNFGEETRKEIAIAGELADKRAQADTIERQLLLERAEANRKFNELREKAADKENVSIQDRIAALKEAGRIDEEITIKEIAAAKLRFEAKVAENALSESTKEDLDEQARLEAELINLETARLKKSKTLTAEITTNLREAESERKAIAAKIKADEKADQAIIDKKKKEKDKKLEDDKKVADKVIADAAIAEKARLDAINLVNKENDQRIKEEAVESEEQALELKKEKELEELEALNATEEQKAGIINYWNNEIVKSQQKSLKDKAKIKEVEKGLVVDQVQQLGSAFGQISSLLDKGTAAGKAAALGDIILKTGTGFVQGMDIAQKSAAGTGPAAAFAYPVFFAMQIASVLGAVSQAKNVLSQVKGGGGGGGGSVTPPPTPVTPSLPPAFNTVGASDTNQLADAIGGQAPARAYVVSGDITTAQGLERNTIEGATI